MAFDAGEIVATLKLDRAQFNIDLDRAKADVDAKFKDPTETEIKPVLDTTAMEEVLAEEEPLRKDIEPEVKPTYAKSEAESVGRSIVSDILTGAEDTSGSGGSSGGMSSLMKALLGQGLNKEEMTSALKGLGFTRTEIEDAMAATFASGGTDSGSTGSTLKTAIDDFAKSEALQISQAFDSIFGSEGVPKIPVGGSSGRPLAASIVDQLFSQGLSKSEIASTLSGWGKSADQIVQMMDTELLNSAKKESGSASIWSRLLGGAGKAGAPFDFFSGGTGIMAAAMNPIGASAGTAFLGAFGLAIAAGLSGTIIGAAGSMAALLPGFLDLMKGYSAYQAISTGASTAGMSTSQLGLGKQIGGLIGSGSKGLGAAETQIMPMITKFVGALTKLIPLINEFAQPAIKAMSGFFNVLDKGMGSAGFKSFMKSMSTDVGPIMTEFGQVVINLGTALGGFLKLFGGVAATQIGPWFVKITGEFSKFMNHVKLGHGFVNGMVTVFSNLGKVIKTLWPLFKILGAALAPVGLQIFRIVGWMASWISHVVKLIPKPLLTNLLSLFVGLLIVGKGLAMIVAGVKSAIEVIDGLKLITGILGNTFTAVFSPEGLIILGIIAVTIAIYELQKHWKTVWDFIKNVTLDVWHFIDNNIIHPIAYFFEIAGITYLDLFKKQWDVVWGGIKDTVQTIWAIIKPIFDSIGSAISSITGGISGALSIAGKISGAIHTGLNDLNPLHYLASGGPASANMPYIVGEQGPELFVPSASGTVIPNGQFGGGKQQIVFQIDARGHSSPQQVAQAVRTGISMTLPMLQSALARGAA